MLQIQGSLSNRLADVTARNMLRVFGVMVGPVMHMAYRDARTFTFSTTQTPAGPGDYFFYIQNTSATRDLFLTSVRIDAAAAETVTIDRVGGTPAGGTALTPANRSLGNNRALTASAEAAADITGLTTLAVLERIIVPANGQGSIDLIERPIIMQAGTNEAIALVAVTGANALNILVDVATRSFDQAPQE